MDQPWTDLPRSACDVDADPRLVHQVLGAVVTQPSGDLAGHRFTRLSRPSQGEAVVRFDLRLMGRPLATTERVTVHPGGVSFEQLDGYLPAVEESLEIVSIGGGATQVVYSGRFRPRPGLLGRSLGAVLARAVYGAEGRRTLAAVKSTAEARQARSAMFRRPR
ncbi:MAG: hypothetical protein ABR573_07445 [Candidatus Dormibacteria bacterium]